jgi:glutathione S-transferase
MTTLYTFGPAFGLPDPSPFVIKAHLLLKMAGLAYVEDTNGFNKAPKGKVPYLSDDGVVIADSTFIRFHIEQKYGFDFDAGLTAEQKAASWAIEKMCEDHLYWATMSHRWMNDENFKKGPAIFFEKAPALIRPLIIAMVRKKVRRNLNGHGLGRHSDVEINQLAVRDIDALSALIGDKPYLMGDKPCAADAMVFASVAGSLSKVFTSAIRDAAEKHPNFIAYRDRMMAQYFPDMAKAV